MLNKYLLFPFFGMVLPIVGYLVVIELRSHFVLTVPPVGEVTVSEPEVATATSDEIIFTGDVLLARNIEQLMRRHGTQYPFVALPKMFGDTPTIIGNFESAILQNHIPTPAYVTTFSVDKTLVPPLASAGFTHMSLANNHSLDYGLETLRHTETVLADANIIPFGNPLNSSSSLTTTFESGDYTIGLIALNQVFTKLDWTDVEQALTQLSATSDYQIAYIHWGDEYILKHNQTQEDTAHKLIDLGVDVVIGHHPHVTQDIQIYKDRPIFYSLGNFIFDQYFSVDVQQGLLVRLQLSPTEATFDIVPVSSEGTLSQPHLMSEADSTLFLKNLARRSDPNLAQNIAQGKLILPLNLATYPQNGMITP